MNSPSLFNSSQPKKRQKLSANSYSLKSPKPQSEPSLRISDARSPFLLSPLKSELNYPQTPNPTTHIKKKGIAWSAQEDDFLRKAVQQHSAKNWKEICKSVPGRTSSQCSQRWRRIQPYKNRQPWTKEEDKLLADLTQKFGCNWSLISSIIEGRTGKQVRERYINKLDPKIDRTKFREDEDLQILKLYRDLGPKWREISKSFQGRPENMIKNRFYSYIKKRYLWEEEKKASEKEEKMPENIKDKSCNDEKAEMDEIQSKFGLLLCKSETQKNSNFEENPLSPKNKNVLASLAMNKEKELSTEYTFNTGMGGIVPNEQGNAGDQFVNNLGTKFMINSPEQNELGAFLYDKNQDNPINYIELEGFNFQKGEEMFPDLFHPQHKSDKLERMTFLNRKKEIIESMLVNVMNKIQECESNKETKINSD